MLGDFASLDVQNTYRGSDAYVTYDPLELLHTKLNKHIHTQLEALTKKSAT
ncbi:hypothetical protein [Piscirickettsia salmonis]|uniref:hypothetical protein n=1 Tax=Piscirickettsia salmonis TaxID=1238 RepID=UPI0012DB16AC|nr:hypothetical protein [Piscirickettsia salmonis]